RTDPVSGVAILPALPLRTFYGPARSRLRRPLRRQHAGGAGGAEPAGGCAFAAAPDREVDAGIATMSLIDKLSPILSSPVLYLAYQTLVGGLRARQKCIAEHVRPTSGLTVLDIGCGPGCAS